MRFVFYTLLFGFLVFQSCKTPEKNNYFEIKLESGWVFRNLKDTTWLPANVPGNILHDLFIQSQIDDPRLYDNLNTISWIEKENWEYKVSFDVPQEILLQDSIYLSFSGIYPFSEITLNDTSIGKTTSLFQTYSFSCKRLLKQKQNQLRIKLNADQANKKKNVIPALLNGTKSTPSLINFGILQPVKIIAWSDVRINDVYINTDSINKKSAFLSVNVNIEAINNGNGELIIDVNNKNISTYSVNLHKGKLNRKIEIQIDNPDLWWCSGMGRQPLYKMDIRLIKGKEIVSKKTVTFGIRKIEWIDQPDSVIYGSYFRLNNKPVFIKGANFLPYSIYQMNDTSSYGMIIDNAASANINMFRIIGDGIYETPEFYNFCNEKGILIWQDLSLLLDKRTSTNKKISITNEKELVAQAYRLSNNPSMALFFGNMEGQDQYLRRLSEQQFQECITNVHDIIKGNWPDIPFLLNLTNYKSAEVEKTNKIGGDWSVWYDGAPISNYEGLNHIFVYEFGVQSMPDMKTIHSFVDDNDYDLRSPILATHQFDKAIPNSLGMNGTQQLLNYTQMYYNEPDNFESEVYLSQVFQAQALKHAIETYRISQPTCMGAIFWHFNDSWPSISWSVLDNYNRIKPAYFAIKDAYKNVILVPQIFNNQIRIWGVNDSLEKICGEIKILVMDFNGDTTFNYNDTISLEPGCSKIAFLKPKNLLVHDNVSNKMLLYAAFKCKDKLIAENLLYFVDPSFLDLPVPDIQMKTIEKAEGFQLILSCDKLVKNLILSTSKNESRFTDNNFDILPGETKTIFVEYSGSSEEFSNDLIMKSLIDSY